MVSGQPEELTGRIKCRRIPIAVVRNKVDIAIRSPNGCARLRANSKYSLEIEAGVLNRRCGASSKE